MLGERETAALAEEGYISFETIDTIATSMHSGRPVRLNSAQGRLLVGFSCRNWLLSFICWLLKGSLAAILWLSGEGKPGWLVTSEASAPYCGLVHEKLAGDDHNAQ